ncbi:hypothetical protein LguiB_030922 [Lonicera macranthoides]
MDITRNKKVTLPFIVLFSLLTQLPAQSNSANEIQVGVILDMGSWLGKTLYSCITLAISDFYTRNNGYKTRIALHTRDSEGDPMHALSAAIDLLDKYKVQAIIGPQTFPEANFLAVYSNKSKVPIFSFTSSHSSFTQHPYFVQIGQDEPTQFKAIASLVESFKWRNVIFIYEDTDHGRDILTYMVESFLEKDIQIAYTSAISLSASDAQILEELSESMTVQTTVFVVHMSLSLASRFLLNARRLGLVSKGYTWILTDKTLKTLHPRDVEIFKSLQGVIGVKSYVPQSLKLLKFNSRWRKKHYSRDSNMEMRGFRVLGLLAYDATWALATAVERIGVRVQGRGLNFNGLGNFRVSKSGKALLSEISRVRFKGLSGEYQLTNGKVITNAFEIVNVIKKRERRVGFWTRTNGVVKEIYPSSNGIHTSTSSDLDKITWPGMSEITPKGWSMRMSSKKLRIAVPKKFHFKELVNIDYDNQTNKVNVTGFCMDVFRAAIEALPYEVDYEFIPFFGLYDDLIYQVYLKNYDAAVGDITIVANRSLYVDFTLSYTDIGVGTIARINKKDMWIFLKPLDADLWLSSLAFFLLTGFVVWLIEHPSNSEFQGSSAQQIATIFWFAFGEKLSSNLSKFVVTVWVFVVLILTSSYTATLASLLTVQQIQLTTKGDFIGYNGGSLVHGFIVNNLNFKDNKLKPYVSPEEYADALSRGSKNGGAGAIIDEIPYIKIFLAKYPNDYAMITSQPTTTGFGFAFRKGSPLVPDMSREIAKLREEGKLKMMEEKWFKSESSLLNQDSATKPKTLDLDNFRVAGASKSSVAPPSKIRRLICSEVPVEKDKTPEIVSARDVKAAPVLPP